MRRWLRGESLPEQDKLQVLAEWLQVEPHELRFGAEAAQRVQTSRNRWETALAGEEREVLQAYLELPIEQRKIIMAFVKAAGATS